jgi:hypothetical protein
VREHRQIRGAADSAWMFTVEPVVSTARSGIATAASRRD